MVSHRLSATPGLSRLEVPSPSLLASQKRRLHLDFLPEEVHVAGCNSGGRCVIREAHLCFSQLTHVITQPLHDHTLWEVSCVVGLRRGAGTKGPPLSKTNRTGKGYWEKHYGKGNRPGLHHGNLWCSVLCADSSPGSQT